MAEIGAWTKATFGVVSHPGGVADLVVRLRAAAKVPRPCHEKADAAAREAWKRKKEASSLP